MSLFLQYLLPDGGPRYTETDLDRFIAEPWNTASAIIFCGIALYWLWRLKGQYRQYWFMTLATTVLAIGSVGGVLYHGFRSSALFLAMDWIPILLLSWMASFYFFMRASRSWGKALLFTVAVIVLNTLNHTYLPPHWAGNITYLLLALLVITPTVWILYLHRWHNARYVFLAFASFGLAITCRFADKWSPLPMGTHFLWHIFGAITSALMFYYLYHLERPRVSGEVEASYEPMLGALGKETVEDR